MTEKEFLTKFIDFIYHTKNKSNWYLAIDNFLQQTPPLWTNEYPTKTGYYWIRNWGTIEPQRSEPVVVEVTRELTFYQPGDEWVHDRREVAADTEWCGPIPLPENYHKFTTAEAIPLKQKTG